MSKVKFSCQCGKSLTADETAAGKKAKCPSCGEILKIPGPKSAAPPKGVKSAASTSAPVRPPANASIWDEDIESQLAGPAVERELASPAVPTSAVPKPRSGNFAKLARRPWWFNWLLFLVYLAVVWLVSRSSPMGSLLLVMPLFFLAVLIFLFGGTWYFLVLMRDDPQHATALFFALLKSFVFGGSASKAGYRLGKQYGGKPTNPSHARPIAIMKFGALAFAFSMGATLIVGILLGTWTKENFRRARFRDLENSRPSMHRF